MYICTVGYACIDLYTWICVHICVFRIHVHSTMSSLHKFDDQDMRIKTGSGPWMNNLKIWWSSMIRLLLPVIPTLTHYSDMVSDIPSGSISGIFFWHSIWNSFWHILWHSLWRGHCRTLILGLLFGSGKDDCDLELAVEVRQRRRRRRRRRGSRRTNDIKS